MDTKHKLSIALLIGVMTALLSWGVSLTGVLDVPEGLTWDQRQRMFAEPAGRDVPIRVILLDEQSLVWAREGYQVKWPWPYELYTPIIQFCRDSGAKAIAFDVQFTEPERYGPSDDSRFAQTIAQAQDFVVAAVPSEDEGDASTWPKTLDRPDLKLTGLNAYIANTGATGLVAERCRLPFDLLAQSTTMLGHIAMDVDAKDQAVPARRVKPFVRFDGTDLPLLGLSAYLVGTGQTAGELEVTDGQLRLGDEVVPINDAGRAVLRYRKPIEAENNYLYPSYSAKAVINSQLRLQAGQEPAIKPESFKDCYVFFGFSASGLSDNLPTPVKPLGPGVEIHATFLDNLLNSGFMHESNELAVLLFTLVVSVLAVMGVLWASYWVRVMLVYVVVLPIPAVVGSVAFASEMVWPIVWPTLAVGAAHVSATVFSLATEGKQRRFIKRAFGHYLSPTVIERVIADPTLLTLGGERREVTVMFVDLEGFTSVAEKLDPHELSGLLNQYLTTMSEAILEEDGTLDKFQGDAVMAFWNAPLDQPDHALRACRAALRCNEKIAGLRRDWFEQTGREPKIRIGIHTGTCVVGNMGAKQRFDYTVLGDTANLASRLEGVNKVFGTSILVSSQTWSQVDGQLAGRGIARVRVAGRKEPVIVIEPYSQDPNRPHATGEAFDQALVYCEEGQYTDAMHRFHQLSQDAVSKAYADKLASILKSPDRSWDGIWHLVEKK